MGKRILHQGKYGDKRSELNVRLSLIQFEEDGVHFVYSPALDLTGYGKSETEAMESYGMAMEEFLRYTTHKNTLKDELKRLGWSVTGKKKLAAPSLPELIRQRDYLVEIFTEKEYRKSDENFRLPALA
jgi:hypothetical protein